MTILIVILHVFVCLFLIAVILLQAGRGQGLSWGVFGGTPQSILGTKTASFLSRVTTVCASFFLVTCIVLNVIETKKARSLFAPTKASSQIDLAKIKQAIEEAQKEQTTTASAPVTEAGPKQANEAPVAQIPAEPVTSAQPMTTNVTPATPQNSDSQPKSE